MVEWLIVLVIVAVLLFLGPKKIPALARSLGRTFGEFRRGRAEGEREIHTAAGESDLVRSARALGIPVEGKSEEDLKKEIGDRVKSTGG